jgi:hypothetical protein
MGTMAAVVVALLAAFGKLGPRARLEVYVDDGPPGKISIKTSNLITAHQSYYCRLRIANRGSAEADGVEVQMLALRKKVSSKMGKRSSVSAARPEVVIRPRAETNIASSSWRRGTTTQTPCSRRASLSGGANRVIALEADGDS